MSRAIQLPQWQVLVVEDDPLVHLDIEQELATYAELTVMGQIENGYLAVEATLQQRPDLVLMDIGLPGLDGIAATQQIKASVSDVKVIMLTSHTSAQEVLASLASGADAYCLKSRNIEVLLTAITAVSQGALYLDIEIARHILQEVQAKPVQQKEYHLTEREYEVLELLVEGLNNTEIATRLYISPNTVKTHMRGLMNKLAVSDRVQVAVKAVRSGLV